MQCRRFPKILGEISEGNNGNAFYNFIYPTVTPGDVCGEWRNKEGECYEDYYELETAAA